MKKGYSNRKMDTSPKENVQEYFFPKANPPVVIRARSREEAEAKLADLNSK